MNGLQQQQQQQNAEQKSRAKKSQQPAQTLKIKHGKRKKGNFKIVKFKSSKNIEVTAKQLS